MPWEKQFDREEVLRLAERTLWSRGYEATSMSSLLKEMGIQKGSFYATFGSKHEVLIASLNLYIAEWFKVFTELAQRYPPLEALERHFVQVWKEAGQEGGQRGCFLVNAAIEMSSRDREVKQLVIKTLEAHANFYRAQLAAAQANGTFPEDRDVSKTAMALLGVVLGMRVLARAGIPSAAIAALRDHAKNLLREGEKSVRQ